MAFHNTQEKVSSQLRNFVECDHYSLIVWHSFIETKRIHYKDRVDYYVVLHKVNLSSNIGQGLQYFFLDSQPPSFLKHSLQGQFDWNFFRIPTWVCIFLFILWIQEEVELILRALRGREHTLSIGHNRFLWSAQLGKVSPTWQVKERKSDWTRKVSLNQPDFFFFFFFLLEVHSSDVPSTYIQSKMLEENVVYYVEQLEGFADPTKPDHVCKLNMALYGVPVAGQRWNLTFCKFLTEELKFVCCDSDPNLYIHHEQDGNFCIMPTAVNDTLFFFFLFEADFIQLVVLNLSHLNYIKLYLFLTSNERWSFKLQLSSVSLYAEL